MTYTFTNFRDELGDIEDEGRVGYGDVLRMLDALEHDSKKKEV